MNRIHRPARWLAPVMIASLAASALPTLPTAQADEAASTFEAENLAYVLVGGATRAGCEDCSGAGKVGNLSSTSSATITGIVAPADGDYHTTISYLAGDDSRRLSLGVNAEPGAELALTSTGGWDRVGTTTVTLRLRKGENQLTLTAPDGSWGPDLDKVDIGGVTAVEHSFPVDPQAADPVPRDSSRVRTTGAPLIRSAGTVTISHQLDAGTATVAWRGTKAHLDGVHSTAVIDGQLVSTKSYASWGGGCRTTAVATRATTITCMAADKPTLVQEWGFDGKAGFTVRVTATASDGSPVTTAMMVPLATDGADSVSLGKPSATDRVLLTPYDNDHWVRYESPTAAEVTPAKRSFEVSALYNPDTREGLVFGSVDMTQWKSGVVAQGNSRGGLDRLQVASGLTDWSYAYTGVNRYNTPREKRSHNPQTGLSVSSSKVLVSWSSDWRTAMEDYGRAVAAASAPLAWDQPTPFGFNSWGGLGARVANEGVLTETSDFFATELPGFANTQPGAAGPYIGIDSYWDALLQPQWAFEDPATDWSRLETYVKTVRANGQEPAIYFQPFANFWSDGLDSPLAGSEPCAGCERQTLREMSLKVNGLPLSLSGSWALDPTNPGVQNRIRLAFEKFAELDIRYIKLDFLTNGYLEADSWYDPTVTNGRRAFDQGMRQALSHLAPDTFIDLAISPTFVADYGHARRISCDVHGALNNWHESNPDEFQKSTEYLLNSLTYGWWLDQVYAFNDADHIQLGNYYYQGADAVLFDAPQPRVWPEGVNRARISSAVITGVYLVSEDFTASGDPLIKQRATELLQNRQVNHLAEIGRSFQPVEVGPGDNHAADTFWLRDGDTVYVAAFNYADTPRSVNLDLKRLGITARNLPVTELWTSTQSRAGGQLRGQVPAQDVRIYAIRVN